MTAGDEPATMRARTRAEASAEHERPVRKDVTRNRALLLAAAEQVVAARGRETTLDDVARHAGLGVATAYRHFANKTVLLQALFEERMTQVERLAQHAADQPDAGTALYSFLVEVGGLQARDRGLRDAMATAFGTAMLDDVRDRLTRIITGLVSRARRDGQLRPEAAAMDVPMIIAIIGSLSDLGGDERPDLWRRYLDLLLGGLVADGSPRPLITVKAPTRPQVDRILAPNNSGDPKD